MFQWRMKKLRLPGGRSSELSCTRCAETMSKVRKSPMRARAPGPDEPSRFYGRRHSSGSSFAATAVQDAGPLLLLPCGAFVMLMIRAARVRAHASDRHGGKQFNDNCIRRLRSARYAV